MHESAPAHELAGRLMAEIDKEHGLELQDALKDTYKVRAGELKTTMLALAEQEAQTKAGIGRNFKARRRAARELRERLAEKMEDAGAQASLQDEAAERAIDDEEAKELQEADNAYQMNK